MRFAVNQTPVKNHQLILMGKTLKELDNIIIIIKTILTTALLELAMILKRVQMISRDCVGKVIYWKLCKSSKFNHANK